MTTNPLPPDRLTAHDLANRVNSRHKHSGGYCLIPCPAHDGRDPNLHLADADNGKIKAVCHSHGCSYSDILTALGIPPRGRAKKAPPCGRNGCTAGIDTLQAVYEHVDGVELCVHRVDCVPGCTWRGGACPGTAGKHIFGKGSPSGAKVKLWGEDKPQLSALVFVEGEKAARALLDYGALEHDLTPVSWRGGAVNADKAVYTAAAGRRCVLWPDADDEGRGAMAVVARRLVSVGAAEIRLVDVSGYSRRPT